jgi:hypothetical protein
MLIKINLKINSLFELKIFKNQIIIQYFKFHFDINF